MTLDHRLASQVSILGKIILKGDDSEILSSAEEILLFLNHLQDFLQQSPNAQIPLSSISDIIYGLESNPDLTLRDKDIRSRLLNFFIKVAQ